MLARRRVTLTALSTLGAAVGLAPVEAHAATAMTVYVDNSNITTPCSDTAATAGSQATPYCTITAAGAVAKAGETVLVAPGGPVYAPMDYTTSTTPVSGTANNPITFKAAGPGVKIADQQGFAFLNQHDFVIDGFTFYEDGSPAIRAQSSQNITFTNNTVSTPTMPGTGTGPYEVWFTGVTNGLIAGNTLGGNLSMTGVELDGGTTGVQVLRNSLHYQGTGANAVGILSSGKSNQVIGNTVTGSAGASIEVAPGGDGTVVANNYATCNQVGVEVFGASNVAVAGNTVVQSAGPEYVVSGTVTGVTVENSVASAADQYVGCPTTGITAPALTGISVDAPATAGTTVDYNAVNVPVGSAYNWGGTVYTTAAAFNTGTGTKQGAHDVTGPTLLDQTGTPVSGSIAVDSGNDAAPGAQKTDISGKARFDDPTTTDTGAGTVTYSDRGAFEYQGTVTPGGPPSPVPTPTPAPTPTPTPTPLAPTPSPVNGGVGTPGQAVVTRIAGVDRLDTAVHVSQSQWAAGTAGAVVLATADNYPDALSGVPFAAHSHGPLLLTDSNQLSPAIAAEITRALGPDKTKFVFIVGGTNAVKPAVALAISRLGYPVARFGGVDRYDTAMQIAHVFGPTQHVVVATGKDYPDALSAGPLAAVEDAPIVLSQDSKLDPVTDAFIRTHAAVEAVGGQATLAVGALNFDSGKAVQYFYGIDRFATSASAAQGVVKALGHGATGVGVASGMNFPDALTGGAYAANAGQPLLLTAPRSIPNPAIAFLQANAATFTAVTIFGGPNAVSNDVENAIVGRVNGHVAS